MNPEEHLREAADHIEHAAEDLEGLPLGLDELARECKSSAILVERRRRRQDDDEAANA